MNNNLLILYGSNTDQYIAKIKNNTKYKNYRQVTTQNPIEVLNIQKLFPASCIIVSSRDNISIEELNEVNNTIQDDNIVIYKVPTIDKRTALYKQYKDIIKFCPSSTELVLVQQLQSELDINEWQAISVVYDCGADDNRVNSFLYQVKILEKCGIDVKSLVLNNIVLKKDVDMFKFVDMIITDLEQAIYFYIIMKEKYNSFALLVLLHKAYKHCLQLIECKGNIDTTKLSKWEIAQAKNYLASGNIDSKKCIYNMNIIAKCEEYIKTGNLNEATAISYLFSFIK